MNGDVCNTQNYFSRQKITTLKAFLCLTAIAGVILVIQPSFIFGSRTTTSTKITMISNFTSHTKRLKIINPTRKTFVQSTYSDIDIDDSLVNNFEISGDYYLGVAAAFGAAFFAGLSMVLSSKSVRVCSNHLLMVIVGLNTLIISIIGPLLKLENRFLGKIDTWELSSREIPFSIEIILIVSVSFLSILGVFLLIWASQVAPPIIVSLVRSCEILLGLFLERVILMYVLGKPSQENQQNISMLIIGALLVLISVSAMAASDFMTKLMDLFKPVKQKNQNENNQSHNDHLNEHGKTAHYIVDENTVLTTDEDEVGYAMK